MKQNITLTVSIGAGLILCAAAAWWRFRKQSGVPKSWRHVGQLNDLWCFPIKSCGQIELNSAECTLLGVKHEILRDRIFMVTGNDMSFKTARTFPHMTQIVPSIEGSTLTLEASGMPNISINLNTLAGQKTCEAKVWDQPVQVVDCGDEVASWLSKFILKEDSGCRLVYYSVTEPTRTVRPKNIFSKITTEDTGAFPDASSYMMINDASVNDLKSRLPDAESSCIPLQFRPNFVVSGSKLKPYEEDTWQYVRIGEDVILKCVKPCTRCIFTNIDPKNGLPSKIQEPLTTLKSYRQITDPKLRPFTGDSPVLGVHLGLCKPGKVKVGDDVYVSC